MIGSRVMGTGTGAFAEYAVAHHRHVLPIPDGLTFEQAATLPTGLLTEYGALRGGGIRKGDRVLITAATSASA